MSSFFNYCFSWACCPLPKATCCEDGQHCCPKELPVCDTTIGRCTKNSTSVEVRNDDLNRVESPSI